MATPPVDPHIYYYVSNLKPNITYGLGAGSSVGDWGKLTLNVLPKFSSNNWQFFYQDGVCFIRNYDFRPPNQEPSQLEVIEVSGTKSLRFQRASNTTGQQWTLSHWGDGTWKITNALAGSQFHLGFDNNTSKAALTTDESWQHWILAPNVDVASLPDNSQFPNFNVPNTTMAPEAVSSLPTAAKATTTIVLTTSAPLICDSHITGGIVAGATIGGAVFGLLLAGLLAFVFHRRRQQKSWPKEGVSFPPSEMDARPMSIHRSSTVW
ncbi:MAG: hypothetical protein M1835_007581 [Candelina submexicana]|nr:MAG: hypothetical protein M1835_007581 [Candelina submexicana]